jgi:alpha-L-glutamate ligase-like protein
MSDHATNAEKRTWRFWAWPGELRRRGVLGINARNSRYVLEVNSRAHYPRVDDKVQTKRICRQRGIPVPETYAVIERHGDIQRFMELVGDRTEFVIKPAKGAEGRGIVVVVGHDGSRFVTSSGEQTTLVDLRYHLSAILAGLHSLGGQPDRAIVEQRIRPHAAFRDVAVGGTPDVRIILYRGVPVMAMVRLPTRASRGRANLHQGAVAAGVHLDTGRTFGGVCLQRAVAAHPDTGASIAGLEIPAWTRLLQAAVHLAEGLEMGYIGIDFVLDAELGPVVLEANARPGLAIQLANRCGLLPRLQFIDSQLAEMLAASRRMGLLPQLATMESRR